MTELNSVCMTSAPGLYLSQSYQDAWADYIRALNSNTFPVWDYVILTASNEHQAESFRLQIGIRGTFLPPGTEFVVIPDEGGVRVGSGGATLSVLRWLKEHGGWAGKRVLVIHSGGDSKRVPQYSALGKLFSPVPNVLPDGRSSTLFDELVVAMSPVPGRFREGMLLLSGDVLLLFNPLLIDWSGNGAAVISFKEDAETGQNHGVYLRGEDGNVKTFLHKQSVETLRSAGAVNSAGQVDIDTGMILFGTDLLNSLWSLISSGGKTDELKYRAFVNDRVRLSLYGDFQYPLAADSTLEQFYLEKPEGVYNDSLKECRTAVWQALRPYRLKLLRLAPARFLHFGTTKEILNLMCSGAKSYSGLGWGSIINSSANCPSYNSVVSPAASVGEDIYAEVSYIHPEAEIGEGTVVSYVDIYDEKIPPHVVLHGLKQTDGKFVCRIFGTEDNPKENKLFGHTIPGFIAQDLWTAPIYPEKDSIREAVAAALALYEAARGGRWESIERGKSLEAGFHDADPEAIPAWNRRMAELIRMNDIQRLIDDRRPAGEGRLDAPLTKIQNEWLEDHLSSADYGSAMRLHYYVGTALGGAEGEKEIARAFRVLSEAVLAGTLAGLRKPICAAGGRPGAADENALNIAFSDENAEARIAADEAEVSLPLRVNWGGGWSDTPPYCNENGGTVLNAAILLNGERPVSVRVRKLPELKIVFESRDMDARGEFTDIAELQRVGDPFDSFILQKAALLACGVIPASGGNLDAVLGRLGGGIWMDTEVTGVPKGSGLGTSSILAAACVKALFRFLGMEVTEDVLYNTVLCMEQMMSTGGGWQDQVGGATDGIKYITSGPGLRQKIRVTHLQPDEETMAELNERFCLIYTGQRRLARNLLRHVIGRYIGNEPETVYALNEIQRTAALMRFELERGNVDAFAQLLSEHWKLSIMLDAGSTNTLIDQIFDSVDDLIDGRMVCGAGGGGFLQVVLRRGVGRERLQRRLKEVFSDTDINVWECTLV